MVERPEVQQREPLDRIAQVLPRIAIDRGVEGIGGRRGEDQQVAVTQRRVQVGCERQASDWAVAHGKRAALGQEGVLGESNHRITTVGRVSVDQVTAVVFGSVRHPEASLSVGHRATGRDFIAGGPANRRAVVEVWDIDRVLHDQPVLGLLEVHVRRLRVVRQHLVADEQRAKQRAGVDPG